jgi:hypothetical protein
MSQYISFATLAHQWGQVVGPSPATGPANPQENPENIFILTEKFL